MDKTAIMYLAFFGLGIIGCISIISLMAENQQATAKLAEIDQNKALDIAMQQGAVSQTIALIQAGTSTIPIDQNNTIVIVAYSKANYEALQTGIQYCNNLVKELQDKNLLVK